MTMTTMTTTTTMKISKSFPFHSTLSAMVWAYSNLVWVTISFSYASFKGDRLFNFFLMNAMDIPGKILSILVIKYIRRRPSAFFNQIGSAIPLIALGKYYQCQTDQLLFCYFSGTACTSALINPGETEPALTDIDGSSISLKWHVPSYRVAIKKRAFLPQVLPALPFQLWGPPLAKRRCLISTKCCPASKFQWVFWWN